MRRYTLPAALTVALTGTLLTACGGADTDVPAPSGQGPLAGVCPGTVVIQTDWYATPERAAAYQLVGPDGKVDVKKGAYAGPLGDTGVNVEVRLGGPFLGGQPVPAQMYQDKSITLGFVPTDDAVAASAKFPVKAVFSSLDITPQIIMWDPATYPNVRTWKDVAATGAKVTHTEGKLYMDYLVSKGYVTKDQADSSFDGTPSRFVADKGRTMQQGYVSNEPFRWEHDVQGWKKPVKSLLIHDAGYEIYQHGWSVRAGELEKNRACLAKLVPLLQKAQADYMADPKPVNEAMVRIAETIPDGPPITLAGNEDAVGVMRRHNIVGNGADATLGDFDLKRVERVMGVVTPILKARGDTFKDGLKPEDIVTNEFVDKSIGLR
ncbi:hypothetical protein [Actinomadura rugatobispora]|uniref:ABC transporter substrate-binding protein n=1 Tax=Actinomadura rugatobispora TaxID=1994 RepID=A0ABW1AJN9_9ACTN|nr:nitrate ABC transporter substrate-binding protein [Actinomadura rugatobispora]